MMKSEQKTKRYTNAKNVKCIDNTIKINRMDHPACVSWFLRALRNGIDKGYREFNIVWDGEVVYPNACVPIAGIIQHYQDNNDITFHFEIPKGNYLLNCGFIEPIYQSSKNLAKEKSPFDKIYRYDEFSQVATLTQAYIDSISRQDQCSKGVLEGLIWCINEVMDNVLVHGQTKKGFVMAQFHPRTKHVVFCVYDDGVGIYNTLKNSVHAPKSAIDAISIAIQEGVGDGKGQGNGLYGLFRIVSENMGNLTITSGPASLMYMHDGKINKYDRIPFITYANHGTIVDFQLDLSKDVNIKDAFKNIGGFDGFDIRIDEMTQDDNTILYDVYDKCRGTATREAGRELRNDVSNILQRTNSLITLDFSNVQTVSSSFIDEFISKLIIQFGIVRFNLLFRIIGMKDTVRFLCDRSTYMRIHDEWDKVKGTK